MKKKIIVYLNGGLGNQMFQYALGRRLVYDNPNSELVLDNWSGFVRDYTYNRVFELDSLPIEGRKIKVAELIIIWIYKLFKKLNLIKKSKYETLFGVAYFVEQKLEFDEFVVYHEKNKSNLIIGYWQSFKYFQSIKGSLFKEFIPRKPCKKLFIDLAKVINNTSNSVALGIRLYEESLNPAAHALDGKMKSVDDINVAIKTLQSEYPDAVFFVFCTHRSNLLFQIDVPQNSYFITHDDGYVGTIERLWLLTQCKHHIFTNSSYYWWGAWLSEANFFNEKQLIFASDNFINIDGIPHNWKKF